MNIYKIFQGKNSDYGTYDSAVVAAETEDEARKTHPATGVQFPWDGLYERGWVKDPHFVEVKLLGKAVRGTQAGVIVASYNPG